MLTPTSTTADLWGKTQILGGGDFTPKTSRLNAALDIFCLLISRRPRLSKFATVFLSTRRQKFPKICKYIKCYSNSQGFVSVISCKVFTA